MSITTNKTERHTNTNFTTNSKSLFNWDHAAGMEAALPNVPCCHITEQDILSDGGKKGQGNKRCTVFNGGMQI